MIGLVFDISKVLNGLIYDMKLFQRNLIIWPNSWVFDQIVEFTADHTQIFKYNYNYSIISIYFIIWIVVCQVGKIWVIDTLQNSVTTFNRRRYWSIVLVLGWILLVNTTEFTSRIHPNSKKKDRHLSPSKVITLLFKVSMTLGKIFMYYF